MGRKSAITAQEMFEYLCTLKNQVSCVQAPGGRNLLEFLRERFGVTRITIEKRLDELVSFKLILKEYYKNKLFRLRLLSTDWNQAEILIDTREPRLKPVEIRLIPKVRKERKFAIFIDYKNISDGMEKNGRKLKDFYPLLQSILEKGKIIFGFVFVPYHFINHIPVMELSHKYHFEVIICPRQVDEMITKDKDSVDAKMDSLARKMIEHSDITDVTIFSGDADFHDLITFAIWQQKVVTIVASRESVSGRFLEMAKEKVITVDYC